MSNRDMFFSRFYFWEIPEELGTALNIERTIVHENSDRHGYFILLFLSPKGLRISFAKSEDRIAEKEWRLVAFQLS